ncbi:MAG: hypothetical protein NT014_00915 [Candidatus Omnitrophica bacterium]|nr:hypothetical protein [Candidatus Omnitrophota bacterium]
MRIGKVEKIVLFNLLQSTEAGQARPKNGIAWEVAREYGKMTIDRNGQECRVDEAFLPILSRAFGKLVEKKLLIWAEVDSYSLGRIQYKLVDTRTNHIVLTELGRIKAEGIRIRQAKSTSKS